MSILLYGCTTWTLTKRPGEEAGRKLYKNVESSIKQVLATTPHETPTIRTLAPHHKKLYKFERTQTRRTLLEKQGRAHKRCTPVDPPHMDVQEWDDQHELTYSSYVRTRDVTLKTCRRAMNDREKWRETVRDIRAGGAT